MMRYTIVFSNVSLSREHNFEHTNKLICNLIRNNKFRNMSQFYYIVKNFIELCIIDEVIELSARFDILEFQRATKFSLNQLSRTRIRTNKSYLLNESYTPLNLRCNTFSKLIFTFHVKGYDYLTLAR